VQFSPEGQRCAPAVRQLRIARAQATIRRQPLVAISAMIRASLPENSSMPRLAPLPADARPELRDAFAQYEKTLGFVPNSVLIMQRRPKMVKALAQLAASVWDPESTVDLGFKRLLAHFASRAAGCRYCMAHTMGGAERLGVDAAKLDALWDYRSSPFYSEAERVALDVALAASSVPNAVCTAPRTPRSKCSRRPRTSGCCTCPTRAADRPWPRRSRAR
jgi:alkylhydroperoxidase family enzyme